MTIARGSLVVLEGLDRSGKSTQCARLAEALKRDGHQVQVMRFPNRTTPIGQMINTYLNGQTQQEDHVIHLLFSANRWECAQEIEEALARGCHVVVDRYYYSGAVYSAAKTVPGMTLEWCRQPDVGLPRPDVCLFLDVNSSVAATRGGYGTERYEKHEMQARVRELFGELRKHADEQEDIEVIDASNDMDTVQVEVQRAVAIAMSRVEQQRVPLRRVRPW